MKIISILKSIFSLPLSYNERKENECQLAQFGMFNDLQTMNEESSLQLDIAKIKQGMANADLYVSEEERKTLDTVELVEPPSE